MPRPTVLVATTNPAMAYALRQKLSEPCRQLGLKLEICPEGEKRDKDNVLETYAYASAEELFDCLAARPPMALADTLVVLDVGADLLEAFQPVALRDGDGWHVTRQQRAGVAVELILRFPQVFPVVLSPAVPAEAVANGGLPDITATVTPKKPKKPVEYKAAKEWQQNFADLVKLLSTAHRVKQDQDTPIVSFYDLKACWVPLHFVSTLDKGAGLGSTLARFARGMRCWFDPTGLRTLVKNYFLGIVFGSQDEWKAEDSRAVLRNRLERVAIAVDEEREFAVLNAYTSYKFGRRAWLVTTFAEFEDPFLWQVDTPDASDDQDVPRVVLRDVDLRFPDIPDHAEKKRELIDAKGNNILTRDQLKLIHSPIWEKCKDDSARGVQNWFVRCVTSHPNVKEATCDDWGQKPRVTPLQLTPDEHVFFGLAKPIASLYNLKSLLIKSGDPQSIASRLVATPEGGSGNHGAPYLNLAMAESLLQQAGVCKNGPVENLIGALLAGEAYELLLGMSKTTALEALMMMHKKEVAAETGFPGVSENLVIDPRKEDIKASLDSLNCAKKIGYLFLSRFWADLRPVYRDAELFEPAEAANRESLIYTQWIPRIPQIRCKCVLKFKGMLVCAATSFGWLSGISLGLWILLTIPYTFFVGQSISFFTRPIEWFSLLGNVVRFVLADARLPHLFWEWLNLLKNVALTSLALQPTKLVEDLNGDYGWTLLIQVGISYVLFGLLVAIFQRKITRG